MKFSWFVNLYDNEGSCYHKGLFFSLGENHRIVVRFESIDEFKEFLETAAATIPEIEEAIRTTN